MLKKTFVGLALACGFLAATKDRATAQPNNGGGPGGNYDCAICWHGGGWGPGSFHYTMCMQTPNGGGGGCQVQNDQCTFSRGCVSLPDDVVFLAMRP